MNSFHASKFGKGKKKKGYRAVQSVCLQYPIAQSKQDGRTKAKEYDVLKHGQPVAVYEPQPERAFDNTKVCTTPVLNAKDAFTRL